MSGKQAKLFGPLPGMVCGPCFEAMRPELDRNGFPIWRCPKCGDEAPRKDEVKP